MTRHETIADSMRMAHWFHSASQGDSWIDWNDCSAQEFWLSVARTMENGLENKGYMINKMLEAKDC